MARVSDIFNWGNEDYAPLRKAARGVTGAYGAANKWLDTIQEWVLIEFGMPHTSDFIHKIAHRALVRLDEFSAILHERHLLTEYPETPELDEAFTDLGQALSTVIDVLDNTAAALERFRDLTRGGLLAPLSLKTEELMIKNSAEYSDVLKLWAMYDRGVSASSLDNWVLHLQDGGV